MHSDARTQIATIVRETIDEVPAELGNRVKGGWRRVGTAWVMPFPRDPRPVRLPLEDERAARIAEVFRRYHPDHTGTIGLAGLGSAPFSGTAVLRGLTLKVLAVADESQTRDDALERILDELSTFIRDDHVPIDCHAPLSNILSADGVSISLPQALQLRPLTDMESTALYSGGMNMGMSELLPHQIPTYTLTRRVQVEKVLSSTPSSVASSQWLDAFRRDADMVVCALRSFKSGGVFFRSIRFLIPHFVLTGLMPQPYFPVPPVQDTFILSAAEAAPLARHTSQFFAPLHSSLEFASSRLADAAVRANTRDRVVDAVTGLEAILLWGQESSELGLRFALAYCSLESRGVARGAAYKAAREAYGIRSRIVHGMASEKKQPTAEQISAAAQTAVDMLRRAAAHFLPNGKDPDYLDTSYWSGRIQRMVEE